MNKVDGKTWNWLENLKVFHFSEMQERSILTRLTYNFDSFEQYSQFLVAQCKKVQNSLIQNQNYFNLQNWNKYQLDLPPFELYFQQHSHKENVWYSSRLEPSLGQNLLAAEHSQNCQNCHPEKKLLFPVTAQLQLPCYNTTPPARARFLFLKDPKTCQMIAHSQIQNPNALWNKKL